jgi:hypothetical protein
MNLQESVTYANQLITPNFNRLFSNKNQHKEELIVTINSF